MNTKPQLIISSLDAERLEALLESLPSSAHPARAGLETELARAEIVAPEQMPPTVVTMNSTVKFTVDGSGEKFCLTLVYPKDMDAKGGSISVLSPVGSALLGLSQGDRIEWPKPGGGMINVRVDELTYQPERAGEFFR